MINVNDSTIEDVYKIHLEIPEFRDPDDTLANFKKRLQDKVSLVLAGSVQNQPAGYLIAYDRWSDSSIFCWMAAVKPDFRRKGIFKSLMEYQYRWARDHGYKSIKIITRNSRREMLSYLVKNGFNFLEVDQRPKVEENRIILEKDL
jgi:GNAT superfamily N-acetyltransferase